MLTATIKTNKFFMGFKMLIYSPETYDNLLFVRRISDLTGHNREVTSFLDTNANISKDIGSHNCKNFILNLQTGILVRFTLKPREQFRLIYCS
jgi:hypothetical protein